jgi:hypothetical protein
MPPPPPLLTSKLPGASSLLRVRCIISEWTQTWKSSTVCVLGASYQLVYAVCFGGPVFDRSPRSRLRLLVLLEDCPSPQLLSAFHNSKIGVSCFYPLVGCKYLHLTLSAACWVFRRVVMIPFRECSITSLIVSGLGTSPWAGSHFVPVAGSSFPQAPLCFHPCNFFRQEQLWVRDVTVGWHPHPSFDVLSSCWRLIFKRTIFSAGLAQLPSLFIILTMRVTVVEVAQK